MKYFNQLEHANIPYPTDVSNPDSPMVYATVKEAGCGLCCLAMMIDRLTTKSISLEDLVTLSKERQANLKPGTDMKVLGPVIADIFHLDYDATDCMETVIGHLRKGGSVIANVGGDREGYTGVFSHGGHYIYLLAEADGKICVLDPSLKAGKFEEPGREGKVIVDAPFVYCDPELLKKEADNRTPGFYLFSRKAPGAGK